MAQEAASEDVVPGDSVLLRKAANRKGAPRWRGPAKILDIDETGATAKSRSQTLNAARYCVGKTTKEKDVSEKKWNPASGTMDPREGILMEDLERAQKFTGMPWVGGGDPDASRTDL